MGLLADDLPEEQFDIVSVIDVLHHVPEREQRRFVAEAAKRVAPGGLFLYKDMASDPLWRVLLNRFHDLLVAREVIHEVPLATVCSWNSENGLSCVEYGLLNRYWYGHEIAIFRREP